MSRAPLLKLTSRAPNPKVIRIQEVLLHYMKETPSSGLAPINLQRFAARCVDAKIGCIAVHEVEV